MILSLGTLVEENLRRAVKAVEDKDSALAEQAIDGDKEIDRMEVSVEEECLKLLALHQPVAFDLRFIVSVLKINRESRAYRRPGHQYRRKGFGSGSQEKYFDNFRLSRDDRKDPEHAPVKPGFPGKT